MSLRTKRHIRVALASVLTFFMGAAGAAQVDLLTVDHHAGRFKIEFDGLVEAPASRVYALLTDYQNLARLNPGITAVRVESMRGGRDRVRMVLQNCIAFFCKEIVQVEDVTKPAPGTIVCRIVPGAGDFESGSCLWRISSEGARTRVHYEATRVAGFEIPPLIGPWAIGRAMHEQFQDSIENLERLARPVATR